MVPMLSPAITVLGGISKLALTSLVTVSENIFAKNYGQFVREGLKLSSIDKRSTIRFTTGQR